MANKVGLKGQVVIAKEIRDRLGIRPGWLTVQKLVEDHVVVYFVPPEHAESLKGSLAPFITRRVAEGDEWEQAREAAWNAAARGKATSWQDERTS